LHDADPDGYNIARTLRDATQRMPDYKVDVIDLGLHLEEALDLDLETEEFTRTKALPEGLVLTETERRYFQGRQVWSDEHTQKRTWKCERIELNAFTAPDLVAYVKRQLERAGVRGKVIPPADVVRREAQLVYEQALETLVDEVVRELIPVDRITRAMAAQFRERVPWHETRDLVEASLKETPTHAWRQALKLQVQEAVEAFADEATDSITARIRTELYDGPSPGDASSDDERC
jgi:hypothetical protein